MYVCMYCSVTRGEFCRADPLSLIDALHIFPVVEKVISFFGTFSL